MDNSTARFPEANTILGTSCGQEVVNLSVYVLGSGQVLVAFNLCLDQMVAMDCGRNSNLEVKAALK